MKRFWIFKLAELKFSKLNGLFCGSMADKELRERPTMDAWLVTLQGERFESLSKTLQGPLYTILNSKLLKRNLCFAGTTNTGQLRLESGLIKMGSCIMEVKSSWSISSG